MIFGFQKVRYQFFTISFDKYTFKCGYFNEFFMNIDRGLKGYINSNINNPVSYESKSTLIYDFAVRWNSMVSRESNR